MRVFGISFILCFFVIHLNAQQEIRLPEKPNNPKYVEYTERKKGVWYAVEANGGSSILTNHTNAQRAGFSVTAGYMFSEFLKMGIGAGANFYVNNNDAMRSKNMATIPVFFDIRGTLASMDVRDFAPYWSLDIGGAVYDGFFFSPTFGMRLGSRRSSWLLGLSYTLQCIQNQPNYPEAVSFASFKVGYEF